MYNHDNKHHLNANNSVLFLKNVPWNIKLDNLCNPAHDLVHFASACCNDKSARNTISRLWPYLPHLLSSGERNKTNNVSFKQ